MLFLTPFVLGYLGNEEFGIWALVGVISSYAQLSEFGISESLVKFIAEYQTRNDTLRLNQLINTALVIYLILSSIFCILFILSLPFIVDTILNIPPDLRDKAAYVFTVGLILFFVNLLTGIFSSLVKGFQRMEFSNGITIISLVLTALGTIIVLHRGYGLIGLIYNNACITPIIIVLNVIAAKRLFPEMKLNPFRYFNRETLNVIWRFSWKIQVSNITQLLVFQIDRILLSHYIGLEAVSFYEIANRIAFQGRNLIVSIFSPMIPAASSLQAQHAHDVITGLYRRSFKYMSIITIPFSFLIIALAHPFINIWMGSGFETSAFTIQFLMIVYMTNLLTGPGSFILSGINKPHIGMISSVFAGILNLFLCLLFVKWIGYYGIIIGIFASISTSGFIFIWLIHKNIPDLDWGMYREYLSTPIALAVSFAACLYLLILILPINGYSMILILGFCYMALFYSFIFRGNYLDDFDRSMINKLNPLRSKKHENQ